MRDWGGRPGDEDGGRKSHSGRPERVASVAKGSGLLVLVIGSFVWISATGKQGDRPTDVIVSRAHVEREEEKIRNKLTNPSICPIHHLI